MVTFRFKLIGHIGAKSSRPAQTFDAVRVLKSASRIVIIALIVARLFFAIFPHATYAEHFVYLAYAFNHGSFAVNDLPNAYPDKIILNEQTFVPLGPMPAFLLMPLVARFGMNFDEIWLALVVTAANTLLLVLMLRRIGVEEHRMQRWLIALFVFGTVYFSALTVGRSWLLSHLLACLFILLAINEGLSRRRAWLLGVWFGCAFLTRGSLVFTAPFFLWALAPQRREEWSIEVVIRQCVGFFVGVLPALLFFFYYNHARFGNMLETGYAQAILATSVLERARQVGLFSLAHIPKNLYFLLLATPVPYPSMNAPILEFPYIWPSPWGMGIFFTTPAFIYAFRQSWGNAIVRICALTIFSSLIPLLTYYGIGYVQFGYRYALDFYPFLFVLASLGIATRFNRTARALIVASILVNLWGAWTGF